MKTEDVKLAIDYYEKQLNSAQVVLDSGFGEKENESNRIYLKRKEMSNFALVALKEKLERLENKPLTIEELKRMIGEPVWVDCEEPYWIIIERVNTNNNFTLVISTDGIDYVDVEMKFSYMCQFEGIDNCTFYKHKPKED